MQRMGERFFELRDRAQAEGRRNLVIPKNFEFAELPDGIAALSVNLCRICGNILTITDGSDTRCRQCVLAERMGK